MKLKAIITNQMATSSILFTAMPVVLAKDEQEPKLVKPRDLSIYPEESKNTNIEKENNWEPTIALSAIKTFRGEITSLNHQWSKIKDRVHMFVLTGVSHSESFLNDLRQEKNSILRTGFVAGGGLVGLIVAARKGKFKKLIYTTTGASAAFYVAYPNESEEATKMIKHHAIASYHLINNVTRDLTGYELPPLPAPKSEIEEDSSDLKPDQVKPSLKELLSPLKGYLKRPIQNLKEFFEEKNEPDDKDK